MSTATTATTTVPQPRGAHLVGSIRLPDADSVFRTVAGALGTRIARIPDGETGERWHWIAFQPARLDGTIGLERVGDTPFLLGGEFDVRPIRISPGVEASDLVLPDLGYADAAIASFAVFERLQREGVIDARIRFQVSLPTPIAVISSFVAPDSRAALEPVYESALFAELDRILRSIPHDRLAIQWDSAVEFGLIEHTAGRDGDWPFTAWFDNVWQGLTDRAVRQIAAVPSDVEVGFHLCYGDVAEAHFVQPLDAGNLAAFIARVSAASPRTITWWHLPVPIERDDAAYFAPLSELDLPIDTELYLGLVHREDGVEGAQRRIAAARSAVTRFGVATECGIARAPEGSIDAILSTHAQVTTGW